MRWYAPLALAALLIPVGEGIAGNQTLSDFKVMRLAGFTVLLSPAVQDDPELQARLLWRVEEQLQQALKALPAQQRDALRRVRIWIDPQVEETGGFGPVAYYLPSKVALDSHYSSSAQVGDIAIYNAQGFIRRHGEYNVLLHELAHAYDDQQFALRNRGVWQAFQQAQQQGLYVNISNDGGRTGESYANAAPAEYFAELTVAYFDTREQTPHNRAELKTFDPQGYAAIEAAWRVGSGATLPGNHQP